MLLVAVSGGIDSMCLAEKVRLSGGPFAVAHCNFSLRGEESDADEALVRAWTARHGITCHIKRFETRIFAEAEGISVEMAARRLRYHWFGELCREFGYEGVAVAHNANDNAETLILNLLRGTGLRGITGMKENGFLPDPDYADIPLLRPLLRMTRAEIETFAKENGLSWREDGTNALNDCKRNIIRNLVFPVFADINPSFVQTLNRDMARFRTEMELVHENGPFGAREGEKKALVHENGPFGAREGEFTMSEEAWDGHNSWIPTLGVVFRFNIGMGKSDFVKKHDWSKSELCPSAAWKNVDKDINMIGVGAVLRLGQKDRSGPDIELE